MVTAAKQKHVPYTEVLLPKKNMCHRYSLPHYTEVIRGFKGSLLLPRPRPRPLRRGVDLRQQRPRLLWRPRRWVRGRPRPGWSGTVSPGRRGRRRQKKARHKAVKARMFMSGSLFQVGRFLFANYIYIVQVQRDRTYRTC